MSTKKQLAEMSKKALKSPRIGKHGKRKVTLAKEKALADKAIEWVEKLDIGLPDSELLNIHSKLLNKKDNRKPHSDARHALDMAYKLKGRYTNEVVDTPHTLNANVINIINKVYGVQGVPGGQPD